MNWNELLAKTGTNWPGLLRTPLLAATGDCQRWYPTLRSPLQLPHRYEDSKASIPSSDVTRSRAGSRGWPRRPVSPRSTFTTCGTATLSTSFEREDRLEGAE